MVDQMCQQSCLSVFLLDITGAVLDPVLPIPQRFLNYRFDKRVDLISVLPNFILPKLEQGPLVACTQSEPCER